MIIQRRALSSLIRWRSQKTRKPLILRGARQVGKTSLVTYFGRQHFKDCLIINLEKDAAMRRVFETEDDVRAIVKQIEILKNTTVRPEETLIFLDEIQAAPKAISKLRYFFEDMPQHPVIAAGSLLEFALDDTLHSYPVGRVEFLYLFPLNFEEYLLACAEDKLCNYLSTVSLRKKLPEAFDEQLRRHLRDFFLVGGMPEVVVASRTTGSINEAQGIMEALLQTAEEDFRKYHTRFDPHHLEFIFREIPKWIGKRINFTKLGGAELTSAQVSMGVKLLAQAMLVCPVFPVSSLKFPLNPKPRTHPKLTFLDLGLAQSMNRISREIITAHHLSSIYEGGLAEQFVAQELLTCLGEKRKPELYFWASENKKSTAEVDLIIPHEGHIIPVEVKMGEGGRLASLHQFNFLHKPPLSVRIYDGPLTQEKISVILPTGQRVSYPLLSVPLTLTGQLLRLINEAL